MKIPWIPDGTQLGIVELLTTYLFYDIPVLFSARNRTGHLFLVVWADETEREETWLVCPISQTRLSALERQALDVHTAFAMPEDDFVGVLRLGKRAGTMSFQYMPPSKIDADLLPMSGQLLPRQEHQRSTELLSVRELAGSLRRLFSRASLAFDEYSGITAPLRPLGRLFSALQDCIDAINQAKLGHITLRGAISGEDLQLSRLLAVGSFAGSFGVEIAAAADPGLFDDAPISAAFVEFERLLRASDDSQKLRDTVKPLGLRTAAKYRALLEHLAAAKAGIAMDWSTPTGRSAGSVRLPSRNVPGALAVLTEIEIEASEPITVVGTLVAINTTTGYFDLRETTTNRKYSGKVVDRNILRSETAVNRNYIFTLSPSCEVDSTTGEERIRYDLVSLKNPDSVG